MDTNLLITASLLALAVMALLLRTNIALGILSLCAGYVLADITTDAAVTGLFRLGVETGDIPVRSVVAIALSIIPALLIMVRFRGFQPGRFLLHLAPAVFFALLAVLIILLQLPFEVQQQLREDSYVFSQLQYFRTGIVLSAIIVAIFDLMAHEQKLRRKAKRGKRRKAPDD
jgi:hypothetical protein